MLHIADNELNNRIQKILSECNMSLAEFISVINIYCQSLSDLKKDHNSLNLRFIVTQIGKEKWAIVDKNTMCIHTIVEDELTAYRKAKIYSTTKNRKFIS